MTEVAYFVLIAYTVWSFIIHLKNSNRKKKS